MSEIIEKARKMREAMLAAAVSLDDAAASTAADMFPRLKCRGELVKAGTRINWNGKVKRAAVDLWDREGCDPDSAPTLWEDIQYRDGIRIIPEVITASLAFSLGELGWWGEVLYRSKLDANVWTPEENAQGWEKV